MFKGTDKAAAAIEKSLKELCTDYLDLYLIHWPGCGKLDVTDERNRILRSESWKVLESYHKRGVLKSIGVSNYEVRHLEELLSECSVIPQVNQIELHPQYQSRELVAFCKSKNIHLTAYSSLGKGELALLSNPAVVKVSEGCNKTPAQVLLKWGLAKGFNILPKSANESRVKENIDLDFDMSDEYVKMLDDITAVHQVAWDPRKVV